MIAILDDDLDLLDVMSDMLGENGYQSQCFHSADNFIAWCDQQADIGEHLLILDLNMPGQDGIEVMRLLSQRANVPSLILMSGHDSAILHSAQVLAKERGFNLIGAFSKPVTETKLIKVVEKSGEVAIQKKSKNEAKPLVLDINVADIKRAIENNEFVLHYQPKVDLEHNILVGCEALIRWQHPQSGLIFPDEFLPACESYHMMGELTTWVVKTGIRQLAHWSESWTRLSLAINVSADNINSLQLPELLISQLLEHQVSPVSLTLEITETTLMGELATALDILTRLRLKGVGLSIDDFGTGYSSMAQLHRIPFSELKIDREFVQDMLNDPESRAIVKTCIMLGHELGMQVVAEGVETEAHVKILKELGYDIGQGYYYSRPLNAEDFRQWCESLKKNGEQSNVGRQQ
jgi:EAL domain-containing protein (putative c-di-GMP-specific phosphodiesterase class I)/FixJ family two-component response regulator